MGNGQTERNIFLFDGLGALVSVLLLGVLLPAYQDVIGMPLHILYLMCAAPVLYLIYDAYCFWLANHRNPKWLKAIILANAFYCIFTGVLVVCYFDDLTTWGVIYFASELVVILSLVAYQRRFFLRVFQVNDHPE